MKNIISILIASISIGFFSCETLVNDVNPDRLPRSDNKLVVHGYLSPQDTVISINVYYSSQLIGGVQDYYSGNGSAVSLTDASVTLSNQGKSVIVPFDPKSGTYSLKTTLMPILEGQTYDLRVVRNSETVESSCTVPKAVTIQEIKQDSVSSQNFPSGNPNVIPPKDYLYRIVWQDPASQKNYYRVGGYVFQMERVNPTILKESPNISQLNFRENNRNGEFITDEHTEGATMVSGTGRFYSTSLSRTYLIAGTRRVELMLLNCEKTYYDYHIAIRKFDGDNPFAEPSLIPSNIKNGLGCFAAYNRSTFVLKN